MKLTLDFDKKEVTLFEDTDIVELIAQLITMVDINEWKIKLSEKIVEVEKWSYYPYYPTQPYYCSDVLCNYGDEPITKNTPSKKTDDNTIGWSPYTYGSPIFGINNALINSL
jgi:hypothetical protein